MKTPYIFKKCSKCGKYKPLRDFNKRKRGKYGVRSECRICQNEGSIEYRQNNSEAISQRNKKYRENNKEKIATYHKERYQNNKKQISDYHKKYYQINREEILEKHKVYNNTTKGQIAILNGRARRRAKECGEGVTKEQWLEMMNFFEWKCAYSGKYLGKEISARSIDHIIPLNKGGEHEVWNTVPMYRPYNCSKQDKDLIEWYLEQPYFDEDRLIKIREWQQYALNKWGI